MLKRMKCGLAMWTVLLGTAAFSAGCAGGGAAVAQLNAQSPQGTGFVIRTLGNQPDGRRYGVFIPRSYDGTREYPVILFLHGAFEGGTDPRRAFSVGLGPVIQEKAATFNYIAIFPQTRGNWGEDTRDLADAFRALQEVKQAYRVDRSRVILTGLSIGGYGVWAMAEQHPQVFAALVPMCGYDRPEAVPAIKHIPTWIFHNSFDPFVSVGDSKVMEKLLREAGGNVRLTTYPAFGHDVWVRAYREPALWEWLGQQRRLDRVTAASPR
ncbi:MAG: prolyl oligopeptidase family serine peptidase [Tepidisphaerales bacterium]